MSKFFRSLLGLFGSWGNGSCVFETLSITR